MINSIELLELHDAYWAIEDAARRQAIMQEMLTLFASIKQPTADDCHLMGVMHYMYKYGDRQHYAAKAFMFFKQACELDEGHFLARLFLAHCFHDLQQFEQALSHYQLVDQEDLKAFQNWRYVKLLEQIGFCLFHLDQQKEAITYFEQVLWHYQHDSNEFFASPVEMRTCLGEKHPLVEAIKQTPHYW